MVVVKIEGLERVGLGRRMLVQKRGFALSKGWGQNCALIGESVGT